MDEKIAWFEKIYDEHADAIWRHLSMRLGDGERAKELMQEVFMKTWDYIAQGKKIEYEKAFLYKIARNLFINEIRTNRTMHSLSKLEEDGFDVPDAGQQTDKEAELRELSLYMNKIKESYQEVLFLRYVDDLPVKEIAALLGEQETTISMRIKRGVEALRDAYNINT